MTTALDWLGTRSPAPPERLMQRMRAAVAGAEPGEDLVAVLGEAAVGCLRDALRAATRADAALDLLACDGLLTYAWEAAAASGAEGLDRFAAAYSPDRFVGLLAEVA